MKDRIERIKVILSRLESSISIKDKDTALFNCGGLDQQVEWLIADVKNWKPNEETQSSQDVY